MGKKKSVALMVLLTVVIIALCGLILFPAIPVGVKDWNPIALQYDFSTELDGGYYAYYYPEGVIPSTEYDDNVQGYVELEAAAETDEERADAAEERQKYEESYKGYKGLYLSTDEEYGIFVNDEISESFKESFKEAADEVASRYAAKAYSNYRVAVVDDYALRIELPRAETNYASVFSMFAYTGEMTMTVGEETLDELNEDMKASDLIDEFSLATKNGAAFIKVKFTDAGEEMIEREKENLSTASEASTALHIKIGDNDLVQIYSDSLYNDKEARVLITDKENKAAVGIYEVLLNSALQNELDFTFDASRIEAHEFEAVYGENTVTLLYIALGVILLAAIILPAIKMGRFGIVSAYTSLSYLAVVGICYKYLLGGVFELTLGGVLAFVVGLVLVNAMQAYVYAAIKKEFTLGKTVASSVKGGYKKTLWNVVDTYAVLLLGALALFVGIGGVYTLAIHAIVAVVTAAFCNLLWARFINYVYLSASKNQFKYFRFVREEDEDDE